MDDDKKHLLSNEEIEYAREQNVILDDWFLSHEEVVNLLTQVFLSVSLVDVANAFLYSLSSRDMGYWYVLASYVYAKSWYDFDKGKTETIPSRFPRTFYTWVKYRGGGIFDEVGKPVFYLSEFLRTDKKTPSEENYEILRKILSSANSMEKNTSANRLIGIFVKGKGFPCNKTEIAGVLEMLGICDIFETTEHKGYLGMFIPPLSRDTGDERQSLSYPLNLWRGIAT